MATQTPLWTSAAPQPQYAPEPCGYCRGTGYGEAGACSACNGKQMVLVHQPPLTCPRCHGNGRATESDRAMYAYHLCMICRGTGWVMTLTDQ